MLLNYNTVACCVEKKIIPDPAASVRLGGHHIDHFTGGFLS
jgi:hypothetical protein